MHRDEALRIVLVAARQAGAALFAGNGFVARAAAAVDDRPLNFYMLGSMSLAPALAAGFAHRTGRPAVVVEGDGNALMGLSGLPAVAAALTGDSGGGGRCPFAHVVLDNGVYESTGAQRTLSPRVDLCAVALAAGYPCARAVAGGAELTEAMASALRGPWPAYLRVHIELAPGGSGRADRHPRVPRHPREIARRFRAAAGAAGTAARGEEGALHP